MLTTAFSMFIIADSFGTATISSDSLSTLTRPSPRRCRAAKADTMWTGALPRSGELEREGESRSSDPDMTGCPDPEGCVSRDQCCLHKPLY